MGYGGPVGVSGWGGPAGTPVCCRRWERCFSLCAWMTLLGAKVVIDSNVNFLSHLDSLLGGELNGLSFLGTGNGDEGKSCVFEHHFDKYL